VLALAPTYIGRARLPVIGVPFARAVGLTPPLVLLVSPSLPIVAAVLLRAKTVARAAVITVVVVVAA
jgi:hypothetical protein